MTYQVQDYVRKEAGHMPYIKMNYLCSYFNPFFQVLVLLFSILFKKGSLKASKVILIYFSPNSKVFTILQNFFFL